MLLVILSFIPYFNFSVCNLMATEARAGGEETRKETQCQISKQNLKINLKKFRSIHLGESFSCSLPYGKHCTLTSGEFHARNWYET